MADESKTGVSPETGKLFFFGAPLAVTAATSLITAAFQAAIAESKTMTSTEKAEWVIGAFMVTHWGTMLGAIRVYNGLRRSGKTARRMRLSMNFDQLDTWMKGFTFIHPIAVGASVLYSVGPCISTAQMAASTVMGLVNGPLEEYFWRVFLLQDVGTDALLSRTTRLALSTVMFSLWHVAWCYFGFPCEKFPRAAMGSLGATMILGTLWGLMVLKARENYAFVAFHHAIFNILAIFPAQFNSAFGSCQAVPDFFG